MCQKSLNFTYAFKCHLQKCKWLHFSWATVYYTELSIGLSFDAHRSRHTDGQRAWMSL